VIEFLEVVNALEVPPARIIEAVVH